MDKTHEKTLTKPAVKPFSLLISFVHEWTKCLTKPSVNPVISRVSTFFVHELVHFVQIGQKQRTKQPETQAYQGFDVLLSNLSSFVHLSNSTLSLSNQCPNFLSICPRCTPSLSNGVQNRMKCKRLHFTKIGACTGTENKVYDLEPKHV